MRVVIPFRAGGKSRLPAEIRVDVALAMLGDVVEAAVEVGDTRVVTDDPAGRLVAVELGAEPVDDPGGGQGAAVAAALAGADGICLVVNADLPRVRPVRPRRARAAAAASGASRSSRRPTGRRTRSGCPLAEVFAAALRAGERRAVPRARRRARRAAARTSPCRTSSTTSTRSPTSSGSARTAARRTRAMLAAIAR